MEWYRLSGKSGWRIQEARRVQKGIWERKCRPHKIQKRKQNKSWSVSYEIAWKNRKFISDNLQNVIKLVSSIVRTRSHASDCNIWFPPQLHRIFDFSFLPANNFVLYLSNPITCIHKILIRMIRYEFPAYFTSIVTRGTILNILFVRSCDW